MIPLTKYVHRSPPNLIFCSGPPQLFWSEIFRSPPKIRGAATILFPIYVCYPIGNIKCLPPKKFCYFSYSKLMKGFKSLHQVLQCFLYEVRWWKGFQPVKSTWLILHSELKAHVLSSPDINN